MFDTFALSHENKQSRHLNSFIAGQIQVERKSFITFVTSRPRDKTNQPSVVLLWLLWTCVSSVMALTFPALCSPTQPIDYEGFQLFMATYLENDIPEELCQHLFTSFKSKTGGCSPDQSRAGAALLGRQLISLFPQVCLVLHVLNSWNFSWFICSF